MTEWELKKHPTFSGVAGPVLICIMDGVGLAPANPGNAFSIARTPTLDRLAQGTLRTELNAHGTAVGMPSDEDMGNSEVGHNAMGAGRIFSQGAKLAAEAIAQGVIYEGKTWKALIEQSKKSNATLHFLGLLSDGNVHSHIAHLEAMLEQAAKEKVPRVRIHVLLDGRDVPDRSALEYVDRLETLVATINQTSTLDYRIASGGGRMVTTMDRYNANWQVVKQGWDAHVLGKAECFRSASDAIKAFREKSPEISDQQLPAFAICDESGKPIGPVETNDAVIMFNFRGDRAIEISRAFTEDSFSEFDRERFPKTMYAGMVQYDGDLEIPPHYLVEPPAISRTSGEYFARNQITQLAVSETQKFGHVTYFWNGNRSGMFDAAYETYVEVPSDLRPFEQRPWMKAAEITDAVIDEMRGKSFRHVRMNLANGDMVGHTGELEPAIVSMEAVDLQIARLCKEIEAMNGAIIVTADHGNVEEMFEVNKKTGKVKLNEEGRPIGKTSHTLNPVPFYVWTKAKDLKMNPDVKHPGLANIAATLMHLLGYQAPEDYCESLLR
ncbi:MAG: 2,3-bisphosphoglycerate-independent phosphoglycerate mutase [Myxococcales bacterium]|nr:MAG: 2,3-bisphosphoglycerate-independent phosphoglycerate mutase [Myxococcales bacterium]